MKQICKHQVQEKLCFIYNSCRACFSQDEQDTVHDTLAVHGAALIKPV